jgi:hypothetical protein
MRFAGGCSIGSGKGFNAWNLAEYYAIGIGASIPIIACFASGVCEAAGAGATISALLGGEATAGGDISTGVVVRALAQLLPTEGTGSGTVADVVFQVKNAIGVARQYGVGGVVKAIFGSW